MIGLVEYIKNRKLGFEMPIYTGSKYKGSFNEYLKRNDISENEINEQVFENYYKDFNYHSKHSNKYSLTYSFEWINEMLKSHNPKLLIKALNREFVEKYKYPIKYLYDNASKNSLKRITLSVPTKLVIDLKDFDEFMNICDTYMYCVRSIDDNDFNEKYTPVDIEPIIGDNCTGFVKNECNGIIYHITSKNNEKSIEKKGINPKTPSKDRFEFNRIYFCCGKNWKEAKESTINIGKSLILDKQFSEDELIVLKIDISKIQNVEFYRDPSDYPNSDAIFTFITIPPKFIQGKLIYNKLI